MCLWLPHIPRQFVAVCRRKIFKVETVGDCYVAVAGLPKPLPSHAAAMSRFAKEILEAFQEVMWKLQVTLGPDTGKPSFGVGNLFWVGTRKV